MADPHETAGSPNGPAPHPSGPGGTSLRLRLAVAFLVVAYAVLGLAMTVAVVLVRSDVARSSGNQADALESGFARALATAYRTSGGWSAGTLDPVLSLADALQAQIVLRGPDGRVIARNPAPPAAGDLGAPTTSPVVTATGEVATLTVRLAGNAAVTGDLRLERALLLALAVSGGLAALAAVAATVLVAGRLVQPVNELTAAARSLTGGSWSARVELRHAPRELNELGEALDSLAADLEREDALRRALTADIAHELRTPLAVLQVSLEAMIDGVVPAGPGSFQSLREETLRLSRLVEDLEGLAEARAAALHLERRPFRLDVLADDVLAEIGAAGEGRARRLALDSSPVVVTADERRIRQVITNLLTNAVKFTASGAAIDVRVAPHGGSEAELVVADSGIGIEAANLPHVFERFWRSPGSDGVAGRGIGLAIVKELVEAHGGTVSVESEPGRGSRFTVVLPLGPPWTRTP